MKNSGEENDLIFQAELSKLKSQIKKKNKLIHNLRRKLSRRDKKIKTFSDMFEVLREKGLISSETSDRLKDTTVGIPDILMDRFMKNRDVNSISRAQYPPELRIFALTLHFYSPKAYEYVRTTFKCALPHSNTIKTWYSSINGEPGFVNEAFVALKMKAKQMSENNQKCLCTLIMDEMHIMKKVELVGNKYRGLVDIGVGDESDDLPEATQALVIMVNSLNSHFKVPIAYFLINSMDADQRKNLVLDAIQRCYNVGVRIMCLTTDGPNYNKSLMRKLGADLSVDNLKPFFEHPCEPSWRVYTLLDPCHMIKLIRNTLGAERVIFSENGVIQWKYIELLYAQQEKEGFKLGNKLGKAHIEWRKQKMKVNLAAQTISSSVADAIVFCGEYLKLDQFKEFEETVKFIRMFDYAFDVLNSRNPFGKGTKSPLYNTTDITKFKEIQNYIKTLKTSNGQSILTCQKSTGFLGILMGLEIATVLPKDLINSGLTKYILTYKMSQDHLELFFGAVRSKNGCNNNPTARQFISAFKQLLIHTEIKGIRGNVSELDTTSILYVTKNTVKSTDVETDVDITDIQFSESNNSDLIPDQTPKSEDNSVTSSNKLETLCDRLDSINITEFQENVIGYISGFVVNMVKRYNKCVTCNNAMYSEYGGVRPGSMNLTFQKTRGGLMIPSKDVTDICLIAEKVFTKKLINFKNIFSLNNLKEKLTLEALLEINFDNLFPLLNTHMFETEIDNNHIYKLTKNIISSYLKIKLHQIARQRNEDNNVFVRNRLSRLIIFSNS